MRGKLMGIQHERTCGLFPEKGIVRRIILLRYCNLAQNYDTLKHSYKIHLEHTFWQWVFKNEEKRLDEAVN